MAKIKFRHVLLMIAAFFILLILSFKILNTINNAIYQYEICDNGECKVISIDEIAQPSSQTFSICKDNGICEDVPVNRLLLKEGTDKKYCSNAPYLKTDYVDNWWNANGLIDECEMPPKSDMQFTFKQHNQSILSYTGSIQISLSVLNYENNYLALQILIAEDNNEDYLPDTWIHCGNVDEIKGKNVKVIHCSGTNMRFVKLVNSEWSPSSIFLDRIEILKLE